MKYRYLSLLLVFVITGCAGPAHIFSQQNLQMADNSVTFTQISERPDAFIGKVVKVGGMIAEARNSVEGGVLEIVQFDLDKEMIPKDYEGSGGRFLATSPEALALQDYQIGSLVTVIGEIKGKRNQQLDSVNYQYPVLAIREIHTWYGTEKQQHPALQRDYDPYYRGYPGDPYRDRPIGPVFKR